MNKLSLCSFLFFLNIGYAFAVNEISIREDYSHQTKPGYINSVTLAIEPQGGYASEALYVEYSDKGQFAGKNVEIIHRFNLPRGAVVRDLWLWIGDSVMQAQIKDAWTARHIYDSITSFKRDPAFLNVVDGQYELRIYPLESGKIRKIKMEFLVPVSFFGDQALVDLPYSFLSADNNSKTPLRLLYRYDNRLNYHFSLLDVDSLNYKQLPDTLGMHYYESTISDIKTLSRLTVQYSESFPNGFSCSRETVYDSSVYSIGISPNKIFNQQPTIRTPKKLCIGIDLSGNFGLLAIKTLLEGLNILRNSLAGGDSVKLIISGDELTDTIPKIGFMDSIEVKEKLCILLDGSKVFSKIKSTSKPRILFCDKDAASGWTFPGLEVLAQCSTASNLRDALPAISNFDIVASYRYGYEDKLNDNEVSAARTSILKFIDNGGYFLTYYDKNRGNEKIASQLINGLQLPAASTASNLIRMSSGNICNGLPASFYYYVGYPLVNSDSQAVTEILDSEHNPVVISKKFGKGFLVVTGMWPYHIDDGLKQQLNTALLGLNRPSKCPQLTDLFQTVNSINGDLKFTNILLMSNADALITADNLAGKFTELKIPDISKLPQTHCVTLFDGGTYIPPIFSLSGVNYYGSGYLLSKVAKQSNGLFFGMHEYDWRTVYSSILNSDRQINTISCKIKCDGIEIPQETVMQPNLLNEKLCSSRFYTVQSKTCTVIEAQVSGKMVINDSVLTKSLTIQAQDILNRNRSFLSSEHANDIMLKMLQSVPLDTQSIMKFALQHRLMNDFTAFLALEPNDSLFFMRNPYDESRYQTIVSPILKKTGLQFAVRILKAHNNISLSLDIPQSGTVQVRFFNVVGRLIDSHDISNCNAGTINISLTNRHFGKGMYIAVIKYISHDTERNSMQTRIERFTLE